MTVITKEQMFRSFNDKVQEFITEGYSIVQSHTSNSFPEVGMKNFKTGKQVGLELKQEYIRHDNMYDPKYAVNLIVNDQTINEWYQMTSVYDSKMVFSDDLNEAKAAIKKHRNRESSSWVPSEYEIKGDIAIKVARQFKGFKTVAAENIRISHDRKPGNYGICYYIFNQKSHRQVTVTAHGIE